MMGALAPQPSREEAVTFDRKPLGEQVRLPSMRPQGLGLAFATDVSNVVMHPSGVALVHVSQGASFAARLEAIRASSSTLTFEVLERNMKGRNAGETFGGNSTPMVRATGDGQLALGARADRTLAPLTLRDDANVAFAREDVVLGFDGTLVFENGRLATGDGEFLAVVQFRGTGAVLVETRSGVLSLDVQANRGVRVRREMILGWFGRLVPQALPASEAPCGQHGLVTFTGHGRVLIAST